jgi:CheY-like chemotaxis protein/nitrogen-specific signal transduction histidine kinase
VQEAHRRLEAKVGELRAAQEREHAARGEAEHANSRKDEFLAMLAHELRNPLSPIVSALAVVRSARAPAEAREQALAVIERQVRNMTRIVDDLLDVSRISNGKIALQPSPSDVGTLVQHAIETSQPLIEARRQHVVCVLPERPLTIEVDATRVEQILANLVTNAAKYTPPGGQIWVSAGLEADDVVFRVRDDGIGIPAEKLAHVFDLFHQGDHSIDRARGGLGVGLTLVRKLVELHGGSVTASSAGPGQGSEFVVRFPAGAVKAAETEAPSTPATARQETPEALRILVVEDARDTRDLLKVELELDGHEVMTAEDGVEGLDRFRSFAPQAVVLDIGLPGMDGFEVAQRIRSNGGQDVLLIAATGYGDEQTRARAHAVGFDEHLVKPIAHSVLRSILARGRRVQATIVAATNGH